MKTLLYTISRTDQSDNQPREIECTGRRINFRIIWYLQYMNAQRKVEWKGSILSIQPRTSVWRYGIDNRTHSPIGYNLFFGGLVEGKEGPFSVAISEKQLQRGNFHIGDIVQGTAWTKKYPKCEFADYYRAGGLKCIHEAPFESDTIHPPWKITPPDLHTYEWRGARMLSLSCWRGKCFQCIWANMASVAIEYDWGKSQKWRFESFCYGPKSCKFYKMGKARSVPYKDRGSHLDDGGLDEICTENRGWDD